MMTQQFHDKIMKIALEGGWSGILDEADILELNDYKYEIVNSLLRIDWNNAVNLVKKYYTDEKCYSVYYDWDMEDWTCTDDWDKTEKVAKYSQVFIVRC